MFLVCTVYAGDEKGNRIKNLGYPALNTDAASVQYVLDTAAAGGHLILSIAHGDTENTGAPAQGSMLIANVGLKWEEAAIGVAGTIWRSDGTDPSWQATTLITEVGTLTAGVWNATSLADAYVDNDISLTAVDQIGDVDTTTSAPVQNQVMKWDGNNWVPGTAGDTDEFTFSINTFTDNEAVTQLIGAGVWETTGNITFDVTYNNGPPTAATVTISSDDGGYGVWGTNPLVMTTPWLTKATTEDTDYPSNRGEYVRFTLDTTPADSDTETVIFQNYIWYGPDDEAAGAGNYDEAEIEALTSLLTGDHTRSVAINAGAGDYLVFAYPTTYTQIPVGTDYEDDGGGTGFVFNSITCACAVDNLALSITNTAGYTEDYDVIVSTLANLGNHTLTTYSARTAINTIYWGEHVGTDGTEAVIEGMNGGSSAASNDETRTFSVAPGAGEYVWFAYPKRLGTVSIRDEDTHLPLSLYAASPQTVSVTNSNGWTEDYYAYRSEFANLGAINIETY